MNSLSLTDYIYFHLLVLIGQIRTQFNGLSEID